MDIPRLTDEELNDLARDIVTNKTYITNSEEGLKCSFGLLIMGGIFDDESAQQAGAMYEDYHKAGPRSINGYPFFFSAKVLHKDDLPKLDELILAKQEALR